MRRSPMNSFPSLKSLGQLTNLAIILMLSYFLSGCKAVPLLESISNEHAPAAIGPYAQAVRYGDHIYLSGQIGMHPKTGALEQGIHKQTVQVMENMRHILAAAGSDFDHVLKVTIYLADMDHFGEVNEIYSTYFINHKPARATVQVARLPKDALIEITCEAVVR